MSKYNVKEITAEDAVSEFKKLYDDWAATIEGLTADSVDDWIGFVEENGGLKEDTEIIHFTGADMNTVFKLTGNNAYPDDLNSYAICCKHIESVDKLALPMRQVGMRWFTDIVDNNARCEENTSYVKKLMA